MKNEKLKNIAQNKTIEEAERIISIIIGIVYGISYFCYNIRNHVWDSNVFWLILALFIIICMMLVIAYLGFIMNYVIILFLAGVFWGVVTIFSSVTIIIRLIIKRFCKLIK